MQKVIIVIPCFNEEKRLKIDDFKKFGSMANSSYDLSFILVNDGSSDNTLNRLLELNKSDRQKFMICNCNQNLG